MNSLPKIKDVVYVRFDHENNSKKIDELTLALDSAENVDEQINILRRLEKIESDNETSSVLIDIRFNRDTTDKFYNSEMENKEKYQPIINKKIATFYGKLNESKFKKELYEKLGSTMFDIVTDDIKSTNEAVLNDLTRENLLVMEYTKLIGSIQVPFRGEVHPLAAFRQWLTSRNRKDREEAFHAQAKGLKENYKEFDRLFDLLVKQRDDISHKLGLKNYIELSNHRLHRCYTREAVKQLRHNVLKYVLPLVCNIKKKAAEKMGIDKLFLYDNSIYSNDVPTLKIEPGQLLSSVGTIYKNIGEEARNLFDLVNEREALDIYTRPNKGSGGRCYFIFNEKTPYIHANLTGKSPEDVNTLVHELGHGIGFYHMSKNPVLKNNTTSYDVMEVHSMGMEMLSFNYIDDIFEDGGREFIKSHLYDDLTFLTYGVIVDRFQELIYLNPKWSHEQRNDAWKKLEKKYRPYLSAEGIPFYEDGRTWQRQIHIYMEPLYYIDYCLAQLIVFQFLSLSRKDNAKGYEKYMEYVKLSGKSNFLELIEKVGLKNPFIEKDFEEIINGVVEVLNELSSDE